MTAHRLAFEGAGGPAPIAPPSCSVHDRAGRMAFLLRLRRRGIMDAAVLRAMDEVPREHFVMRDHAAVAYSDQALPIDCGQSISPPYLVAYMTEQLGLRPDHRVLEIGTGSGYQAAVLSRLAREVVTIERYRTLSESARNRLATLGFTNVKVILGDGLAPLHEGGLFDRVLVTAAADDLPATLLEILPIGGTMVLPLGPAAGPQCLVKITKTKRGIERMGLLPVRFVPLVPGKAREL